MKPFEPGFVEEQAPSPVDAPASVLVQNDHSAELPESQWIPGFVETDVAPPADAINSDWAPELPPIPRQAGAIGWIAGGAALFVVVGAVLAIAGFIFDQMVRAPALGIAALVALGLTLAMMSRGALIEVRSYRGLRGVDLFRSRIQDPRGTADSVRSASMAWLESSPADVIDVPAIRAVLQTCRTADEVRAVLHHQALEPLRERATALGLRAGLQAGSLVAITPSPALDGLVAGWRSLALIQEIAVLYGLRPSTSITLGLLRRAAWTAFGVTGVDLAATSVAEHLFSNAPILKHIASAVPGAGVTARRQYRLAQAVAEACSPMPHKTP
jgi:putative membrane protein